MNRLSAQVAVASGVAALLIGGAVYAGGGGPQRARDASALTQDWLARSGGQQVLGDSRSPGVPSIQRIQHDDVGFTVTVAPARPGPNLVRVDQTHLGGHRAAHRPVLVGTGDDDFVRARPRPGTDGLWAVVDLPEGSGNVVVTHGPRHLIPFAVETGTDPAGGSWVGPDGPECLTAAAARVLAGGGATRSCPADSLSPADATALRSVVDTLTSRGVEEIAVEQDRSRRSREAGALVRKVATDAGVEVVDPAEGPVGRTALVVVSGWADAARSLSRITALPLDRQPMRTDGTWLAPWLLTPEVVDSTAGAVVPLDFDVRDPAGQEFGAILAKYLPGQSPTASGFVAWREARGLQPADLLLFAATRTAVMANQGTAHGAHQTTVAWFPGGTVTPIGPPSGR